MLTKGAADAARRQEAPQLAAAVTNLRAHHFSTARKITKPRRRAHDSVEPHYGCGIFKQAGMRKKGCQSLGMSQMCVCDRCDSDYSAHFFAQGTSSMTFTMISGQQIENEAFFPLFFFELK
jgi:hypothetical protein